MVACVANEDVTIGVTQNFCCVINLPQVWPKTVKGRPKYSKHWFKRLNHSRPEVIAIMGQSMHGPTEEDSSSDSFSSSSSSDDETSTDGNCTANVSPVGTRKSALLPRSSKRF
ncbi:hypothetical protein KIN20_018395 [Parelaphostrongylus tenuis]|uniref:Uncharacterized protein n=1 Tax=Parelaphostrongylus tenuis TaxID=148309 RepID=A0AAD5QUA9_PARTN|nr:hypothetical protein KIN20_018395 [Parelaphostrongylus tenuis]